MTSNDYDGTQEAVFDMDENTKIDTFWFFRGDEWDFMGGVYTNRADGKWVFRYRFRYYKTHDDPFDGMDEKKVYQVKPKEGTQEEAREKLITTVTALMRAMVGDHIDGLDRLTVMHVNGDIKKFMSILSKQPFAHSKVPVEGPKEPQ